MPGIVQSSDAPQHSRADREAQKAAKKIPLVELFGPTIQGEGAVIGQQTYFLRFGLCDYLCKMCDSLHAVLPHLVKANAEWLTQDEIYHRLGRHRKILTTNWVTFSGGNPCIHDLSYLVHSLRDNGWKIAVETQGTIWQPWLHFCEVVTVSPKAPGMGEVCDMDQLALFFERASGIKGLNIKVVIFNQEDCAFARKVFTMAEREPRGIHPHQWYLSQGNPFPPMVKTAPENHAEVLRKEYLKLLDHILTDPILSQAKFLPQWHVHLWGNRAGV